MTDTETWRKGDRAKQTRRQGAEEIIELALYRRCLFCAVDSKLYVHRHHAPCGTHCTVCIAAPIDGNILTVDCRMHLFRRSGH